MMDNNDIKIVSDEKAEELYNSLVFCYYCRTPFKECNTIIPGKAVIIGEVDVVEHKSHFWHSGCIFDCKKEKENKR